MTNYLRDAGNLDHGEVTPAVLDAAWVELRRELRAADADDETVAKAVNAVGLSFGQVLVRELGMEWVIATDSHGRDIAVRETTDRGTTGWVVHPRDVVRKRFRNDETGFFTALFEVVAKPQ